MDENREPLGGNYSKSGEATDPAPGFHESVPRLTIPENDSVGIEDAIEVSMGGKVTDIAVGVKIRHDYIGDLRVQLQSPSGRRVTLHDRTGGDHRDLNQVYRPDNNKQLEELFRTPADGSWKLTVADLAVREVGVLERWHLTLATTGQAEPAGDDALNALLAAFGADATDPARLTQFSGENFDGKDRLSITRDVNAFATLIAAEKVEPPLSIGLFGDWGSGKSFFLRKLRDRIEALAQEARKDPKKPFHGRIVQIEFNAWHYVESNLWASLVEHIFRNLKMDRVDSPEAYEERMKFLLDRLDREIEKQKEAEESVAEAEQHRDEKAAALSNQEDEVAAAERKVRRLSLQRVLDETPIPPEVLQPLLDSLRKFGIERGVVTARDAKAVLDEVRDMGARSGALWRTIWDSPEPWKRVVGIGIVLAVPAVAAWAVPLLVDSEVWKSLLGKLSAVVGFGVTAVGWVKVQVKRCDGFLAELRRAEEKVEAVVKGAEDAHQQALDEAQGELEKAEQRLKSARQELTEAEQKVSETKEELRSLTPERRLAKFVEARVASDDYRKHLGLVATVRRDFEMLSDLMRPLGKEVGSRLAARGITLTEEERKHGIDRIVLFIDDLDRCPPDKVVQVLQAVHLLLAFPLFVVVVGVDARWITRSLRQRYQELWEGADEVADDPDALISDHPATPQDYLEKIFQIPFWLDRMSKKGTANYLNALLAGSLAEEKTSPPPSPPQPGPGAEQKPRRRALEARPVQPANQSEDEEDPTPPSRQMLELRRLELEYMQEMAPLIGRSPRSVKRFVNVYRLIRAGIRENSVDAFVGTREEPGWFRRIVLLLGVATGAPSVAHAFFAKLSGASAETDLDAILSECDGGDRFRACGRWAEISPVLRAAAAREPTAFTAGDFQPLLDTVGRYTYRVGRLGTTDR